MTQLYSREKLEAVTGQLKRRGIVLAVISGVLLAAVIWSFVIRAEWLSMVAVILIGIVLIFGWDVLCKPLYLYAKMVRNALEGRSHEAELVFSHVEPETSLVDGVACHSLVFEGEAEKHGIKEQMYYWDKEIPLPDFREGESVKIRYSGKIIQAYQGS